MASPSCSHQPKSTVGSSLLFKVLLQPSEEMLFLNEFELGAPVHRVRLMEGLHQRLKNRNEGAGGSSPGERVVSTLFLTVDSRPKALASREHTACTFIIRRERHVGRARLWGRGRAEGAGAGAEPQTVTGGSSAGGGPEPSGG